MTATPAGNVPPPTGELVFELRVPARAGLLKLIRGAVGEAAREAGCASASADELVMAVDEACQNVIRYGYGDGALGDLIVQCSRDDEAMTVRLIDFAPPVDPSTVRPRPLHELRPGGLGTHLIRESVDEVAFEPPHGRAGNVLRLVKRIE